MNEWWSLYPNQTFWVEITDRSDLGKNIIAPQRAQSGKSTPGYDLLNYVHEGDVVFHWWRKPSNSDNRGFYGYSEIVGQMQEGSIPWKSRGRYAANEKAGPKLQKKLSPDHPRDYFDGMKKRKLKNKNFRRSKRI